MRTIIARLARSEQGQDLVEYTLLVTFVTVAFTAAYLGVGTNINIMWGAGTNTLQSAANSLTPAVHHDRHGD